MATKSDRTIQTPGEAPTPPTTAGAGGDAFTATGTLTGGDTAVAELSNDELRAMLAAQAQQIAALTSAVQNVARAQNSPAQAAVEELPHIDSLDKSAITSPVLTKQGWYVPPLYGTNPAAPKL
jgi:hypothetical protein